MLAALLLLATADRTDGARLARLEAERRAAEARLAAAQQPLVRLAAAAQRLALQSPLATLASPDAAERMLRTRALIRWLGPEIAARTTALRREVQEARALEAAAAQEIARSAAQRAAADDRAAASTVRRLAALPLVVPGGPMRSGSRAYRLPASGVVLVGMGERAETGVRARGLTLATASGAAVIAPAAARIAYAGPFRGYGAIVILDHGHGWTTLLAGLDRETLASGTLVAAGTTLGTMPRADPYLTIELRHGGQLVDVAAMARQ